MKTRLLRLRSAVMPAVVLATLILCLAICPSTALAAFRYSIPKQQDQLTINEDGSVGLVRYFEFAVAENSSDAGTEIWIGLPTSRTAVSSVTDNQGNEVSFETRISGGEYTLILTGFGPIKPGTSKGFAVEALIPDFLFPDSHNEEYVTMKYIPGWWSSEVDVQDKRLSAGGCGEGGIRTGTREWDGSPKPNQGRMWLPGTLRTSAPTKRFRLM